MNFESDFSDSDFHDLHRTPEPLKITMPPYPKMFTHKFTTCYGIDVLAQEIHDRQCEIENRIDKIEKFIDTRLQFYKD